MIIHSEEPGEFSCNVCSRLFKRKSDLENHKLVHSGSRPFSCDICQSTFLRKCHLDQHRKKHSGELLYSCSVCQKSFRFKHYLTVHMRTHTGEKPFSCDTCHKSFSEKSSLTSHVRTHTGEQPFSCPLCLQLFAHRKSMHRHYETRKCVQVQHPVGNNVQGVYYTAVPPQIQHALNNMQKSNNEPVPQKSHNQYDLAWNQELGPSMCYSENKPIQNNSY